MKELIFSLNEIFDSETMSGCLSQYDANFYHIPAYQRGYKWSSEPGGAVAVLLDDLWTAFKKNEPEYYLQYITVKRQVLIRDSQKVPCLEVIDGQQRLTTLSILLSVLVARLENESKPPIKNLTNRKLDYAVRRNFFVEHIYPSNGVREFANVRWEDFVKNNEDSDCQDIYYLHAAVTACDGFFYNEGRLEEFYGFMLQSVKLIVNSVEPHINSETVFRNLNSNKVPLTETELIKGLLITREGRSRVAEAQRHFREVNEVRVALGRDWESLQRWARRPDICRFYFSNTIDGMYELLRLVAIQISGRNNIGLAKNGSAYPLFDCFNQMVNAENVMEKLLTTQQRLADWFNNNNFYHLIGFCRFAKASHYNKLSFISDCLAFSTKTLLEQFLVSKMHELLGHRADNSYNISSLMYDEDSDRIHAVLLALSVFPSGQYNGRFDFNAFSRQDWSLEHIFPQTPEGNKKVLTEQNKESIRDMLGDLSEEVDEVLELPYRELTERVIYENALKEQGVIDGIGNMCLLARGDNSALGNGFFDEKRTAILRRIQQGSFVPKHTFDVFSKMFDSASDDITFWSSKDIDSHANHIEKSIQAIMDRAF